MTQAHFCTSLDDSVGILEHRLQASEMGALLVDLTEDGFAAPRLEISALVSSQSESALTAHLQSNHPSLPSSAPTPASNPRKRPAKRRRLSGRGRVAERGCGLGELLRLGGESARNFEAARGKAVRLTFEWTRLEEGDEIKDNLAMIGTVPCEQILGEERFQAFEQLLQGKERVSGRTRQPRLLAEKARTHSTHLAQLPNATKHILDSLGSVGSFLELVHLVAEGRGDEGLEAKELAVCEVRKKDVRAVRLKSSG